MKPTRIVPLFFVTFPCMTGIGAPNPKPAITYEVMEALPGHVRARLEAVARANRSLPSTVNGHPLEYVVTSLRRWTAGQTVKVAFLGGDDQLRADIAAATQDWTSRANISLDFGRATGTDRYRQWSSSDTTYSADIRVGFNERGYWSLVGTDSVDPRVVAPGQASLNLQGFNSARPGNWRAVVLHEFGHALGFEHEHQHPIEGCDRDFRWDDDPGYVPTTDSRGQYIEDGSGRQPGIYTVLGGPPNNWPQSDVDFNLRQLTNDSHAYEIGPFDRLSIMKYAFPAWMFVSGEESHCFSNGENRALSDGDVAGIRKEYGVRGAESAPTLDARRGMLAALSTLQRLSPESQRVYRRRLQELPSQ